MWESRDRSSASLSVSYIVDLDKLIHGPYEQACSCGRVGSRLLWCKHVENVMSTCNADWKDYLKPWLHAKSWEEQIGPDWDIPSAHEIVSQANSLDAQGLLMRLSQPSIAIRSPGAIIVV